MARLDGPGLRDEAVLKLSHAIELAEDGAMSARFPDERVSRVIVELSDGRTLDSGVLAAPGDPEDPLSDAQLAIKFRSLAEPVVGAESSAAIEGLVAGLGPGIPAGPLLDALLRGPA
jgi:2-methylcitrate dehydratase PrpD